ncbi:hypothetical protein FA13DRAFT_1814991 [Coprinellus micaceus]|uniref:F-box domain-containing protein n=1 Tax=Coprinellus micaceus TaxID=71717 RepID=A0A4Y7T7J0_COPMI|nr:hypothetical protein FA13DRAFT_1814991 [Coprinellus micaceus]
MGYTLPLELTLFVISNIEVEDQESLRSFSRTSSVFLEPCQRILFSHIHLRTFQFASSQGATPGARFLDLLLSSPRLIPYVKQITISDFDNPWASWLPNDLKLVEALDKLDLKKIETFDLKRNYRAKWVLLSQPVRRVIVEICQSPALVDLSLSWAPLALVSVCGPSLKRLRAHDCATGAYAADITPIRRSTDISLENLQLYHPFDLAGVIKYLSDPSTQVRLEHVRTLHVRASVGDDYSRLPNLIQHCQSTLEVLKLEPCTDTIDGVADALRIPSCPRLTELDLEVDATTPNASGERICLAWTARAIAHIPPSNSIKAIRLQLSFDLSDVPGELNGATGTVLFSSLRSISTSIVKPGSFPHLKNLDVEIHSTNPDDDDVESIRTWIIGALAMTPERDLLRLKVFPHPDYGR